jgi:hypothetical protein
MDSCNPPWNGSQRNALGWSKDCKISAAKGVAMVWVVPELSPRPLL